MEEMCSLLDFTRAYWVVLVHVMNGYNRTWAGFHARELVLFLSCPREP